MGMDRDRRSPLDRLTRRFGRGRTGAANRGDPAHLLAPLLEALPPAPPPPGLLLRIEEQIRAERQVRQRRAPYFRMAGSAILGAGAAAMLLLVVGDRPGDVPVPIGVISSEAPAAMLSLRAVSNGRYLRFDHFGLDAAPGRAHEVWLLPDGSGPPSSLGLLAPNGDVTVLPIAKPIAPGDVLAISDEISGGAPGPGPAGPVILTARVQPAK